LVGNFQRNKKKIRGLPAMQFLQFIIKLCIAPYFNRKLPRKYLMLKQENIWSFLYQFSKVKCFQTRNALCLHFLKLINLHTYKNNEMLQYEKSRMLLKENKKVVPK
jgi:hypothetical protein